MLLPSTLWFTNNTNGVSNIAVNFNDGAGYRTLTMGQAINISYADTGRKTWTFKLTLTNNTTLYSHTEMQIESDPNAYGSGGCSSCRFPRPGGPVFLTADNAYDGLFGQGWITVDYANADLRLRKPLIVVEGFDPGHLLTSENQFGFSDFNSFLLQLDGSVQLRNLLQGTTQQYDIIYVDWFRGTDFLQRNALLLERVIRWVNEQKAIDGSIEPNVVLGQSMGGVISRWAIRDMENRGLNHQTRLFISWDAPQQGANVPVAYQHMTRHANSLFLQTAIPILLNNATNQIRIVRNALHLMDVPAARQMLYNRVLTNGQLSNTEHNAWQLELRNLGYPVQSRNIAVSNGSECGIGQGFQPYAILFTLNGRANKRILSDVIGTLGFPFISLGVLTNEPTFWLGILNGRNDLIFDFQCNAQPENSTNQIYKGKITFRKKILWLVNVNTTITDRARNSDPSVLPIDGTPGGMYDTELNLQNSSFQDWKIKYSINASNIPHFNFIPTVSALDIGSGNTTLTMTNYRASYVGATPPTPPFNTPFTNFTTAFNQVLVSNGTINNNEHHIQISPRNGNWVADEINGIHPAANCSFICSNSGITISGANIICSTPQVYTLNNRPAGTTVTWSATPTGIVTIAPSPDGSQATVTKTGSGYITLQATITNNGCGSLIVNSSSIRVGGYSSSDYPITGPSSACKNQTVYFSTNDLPGATNYQWTWSSSWTYVSGQGTRYLTLQTGSTTGSFYVTVRVANACDAGGSPATKIVQVNNCGFSFTTSPNPSTGSIIVSTNSQTLPETNNPPDRIYQIKVIDQNGGVRKQFSYSGGVTTTVINLSNLIAGIYTIQAYNGSGWSGQQIIKQ